MFDQTMPERQRKTRQPAAAGSLALVRRGGRGRRGMGGAYQLEFLLVLFAALALIMPLVEFLRLSLIEQALARATHHAALAVQRDPANCQAVITAAFENDLLAGWLLDANDDGSVAVRVPNTRAGADGALGTEEVLVAVDWDDPSSGGVCWNSEPSSCTDTGCAAFSNRHAWLQLRSRVRVEAATGIGLWPQGLEREYRSWASFTLG